MEINYHTKPRGKTIYKSSTKINNISIYEKKLISLDNLLILNNFELIIPEFQRKLISENVSKLEKIFSDNFDYINHISNPIQLAKLLCQPETLYLIDGQHRYHALKKITNNNDSYNEKLLYVSITLCESISDMKKLYYDINIDKPMFIISKFNDDDIKINILNKLNKSFRKRIEILYKHAIDGRSNQVYKIEELINELENINFINIIFEKFSSLEYEYIVDKCIDIINDVNLDLCVSHINELQKINNSVIKKCLSYKKLVPIKRLNFIDLIKNKLNNLDEIEEN